MPMPITLLYEPPRLLPGPLETGPDRYERFIRELERHAGVPVSLVVGFLSVVQPAGFILLRSGVEPHRALLECDPGARADLASRLVPLAISRTLVCGSLDRLALPGAIDYDALSEWEASEPGTPGAYGPYGLRVVGERVGASCAHPFERNAGRYCCLTSETHIGLPHLLADYLREYETGIPPAR